MVNKQKYTLFHKKFKMIMMFICNSLWFTTNYGVIRIFLIPKVSRQTCDKDLTQQGKTLVSNCTLFCLLARLEV